MDYKRGQIYTVSGGDMLPGELSTTRPGLIVSSDVGNRTSSAVIVVYLTANVTENRDKSINWWTKATGKPNMVLCNQINTVSKKRLGKFLGQLSPNEMLKIDSRLDEVLDLGCVSEEKEPEPAPVEVQATDVQSYQAEIAMWKGLYEKALSMVVDMKLSADIERRKAMKSEVKKQVETGKEVEPVKPAETGKVDINSANFDELRSVGFSTNISLSVIQHRPYKTVEEINKVPGVTEIMFGLVKNKIYCVPPAQPGKVNVNTASVEELADTGMGEVTAKEIRAYRNKHGKFEKLEDLLQVRRFGSGCLKKYGDMLEV